MSQHAGKTLISWPLAHSHDNVYVHEYIERINSYKTLKPNLMLQVVSVISNIVAYQLSPVYSLSLRKSRHPLSGWLINISWHFKLGICSRPCFAYPCWHLRAWTGLGVNVCWFCFQRGNLLLEPICVLPSSCTGDGIASVCWCGCLQVAFPPKHLQPSSQHLCSLVLLLPL